MHKQSFFWLVWLGFVTYAFVFAPPDQPNTFELIKNLSTAQWDGINPLIIALFNIMGVFPIIYSCVMFIDGREQKISAAPFAVASFAVGAFAILPYLALRQPNPTFTGQKNLFLKVLDSRFTGIALTIGAAILVIYELRGDWGDFSQQWQTSRFIHVMSLDFCLLCLIFPALLGDDMKRRGMEKNLWYWLVVLLPLFGPLIYLCVRPSLPEISFTATSIQQQSNV